MVIKKEDYQARKDRILSVVVDEYIRHVSPVGSALIVNRHINDLSPATIRNILAELEEEGFLSHPHTSAGRVPTQKGYRYFVDNLMHEIKILGEERERIEAEYRQNVRELEAVLEKTSEVLSDLTHYTSIISLDGESEKLFCRGLSFVAGYPEFRDLDKIRYILRMIEEKERLLALINRSLDKKIAIFIGHEIRCRDIEGCSLAVSSYKGRKGRSGRIALLGPTRMDYERVVSALDYVSGLMSEWL